MVQFLGWEVPMRRAWKPTAVFLPGESHGQRSLAGYTVHGITRVGHDLALFLTSYDTMIVSTALF